MIYDEKWLKQVIDEAIQEMINENKVKEQHRALSAEELLKYGIVYVDAQKFSAQETVEILLNIFERIKKEGEATSDFYCGITNDIVKRKADHESKDYGGNTIEFVIALQCVEMKTAAATEYFMHKQYGFSIGETENYANGAAPDSDYVYIYRIPK